MTELASAIKQKAKELRDKYPLLKQSSALEILSRAYGFNNWNTACKSKISPSSLVFSQDKVESLLLLLFPGQTPNHKTFVNAFVLDPYTENIYGAKFNASQGMTDDQIEKARSAISSDSRSQNEIDEEKHQQLMGLIEQVSESMFNGIDDPKPMPTRQEIFDQLIRDLPDDIAPELLEFAFNNARSTAYRTAKWLEPRSDKKIVFSDDNWELIPESQTADGVIAEYKGYGKEIDRAIAEDIVGSK